jgi:hypothetical protein
MANTKHKSKYQKPKDLEKSQKPKSRKDIKDYTADDKDGGLNPKSTKDKQLNVLRKTDKEMQDDGKMIPKYEADDRLYKDLEDGDYDPKTAAKRLKKRQDDEEKDVEDVLKDKIENLTREQKERVIREYVRRKIARVLAEQAVPAEEPIEEPAAEEVPADPMAAPTPDATAAPAPTPEAPVAPAPAPEVAPEEQEAINTQKFIDSLKSDGTVKQVTALMNVADKLTKEVDPKDAKTFYVLLRKKIIQNLAALANVSNEVE